jgi:hypothetical protein
VTEECDKPKKKKKKHQVVVDLSDGEDAVLKFEIMKKSRVPI